MWKWSVSHTVKSCKKMWSFNRSGTTWGGPILKKEEVSMCVCERTYLFHQCNDSPLLMTLFFCWTWSWRTAGWRGFEFCEEFHRCHRDERWDMTTWKDSVKLFREIYRCRIVEVKGIAWVQPHFVNTRGQTCFSVEIKALTAKYCRHHTRNIILIPFIA